METSKLIPAPLDEKNIMTDWIEEVFDNQSAVTNGRDLYMGFVNEVAVICHIIENSLYWHFVMQSVGIAPAMAELRKRLAAYDDAAAEDEYNNTYVRYIQGKKMLSQSFYFVQD